MGTEEFFAVRWPALSARLRGRLARAGVPAADRDDVLQETALRLVRHWPYVDAATVDALAHTIATNVWRDRRSAAASRHEVVGEPADVPAPAAGTDVAALSRVELRRVLAAVRLLSAEQRRLVAGAAAAALDGAAGTPPRTAAERMAVMRARRRLVLLLRTVRGLGFGLALRWRPRRRPAAVLLGGAGTVAVALALVLLPVLTTPAPEAAAAPPARTPYARAARDPAVRAESAASAGHRRGTVAAAGPAPAPAKPRSTEPTRPAPLLPDTPAPPVEYVLPTFMSNAGGREIRAGVVNSPNGPRPCVSGFPESPVDTSCRTMAKG